MVQLYLMAVLLASPAFASEGDAVSRVEKPLKPVVYISLYGGTALSGSVRNIEGRNALAGVSISDIDHNGGPMFGVKVGYSPATAPYLAIEMEGMYFRLRYPTHTFTARGPGGSLSATLPGSTDTNYGVFTNAILRYSSLIQPYIGGGIGYSWDNESNGVAFQAMAGVRVKATEIFSVFAEFKYLIAHREGQVDGIGLEGNYLIPSLVGGATLHF